MVSYSPHVLAVNPAVQVKDVKQLVAMAKAYPGKLNFAKQGTAVRTGTPQSLGQWMGTEQAKWAKVVKESGARFD